MQIAGLFGNEKRERLDSGDLVVKDRRVLR